ncbi:MAG: hypothetical protein WA364_19840 [Candidatus Nitrosopolaris sp.]
MAFPGRHSTTSGWADISRKELKDYQISLEDLIISSTTTRSRGSLLYKQPFHQHKYKIFDNHSVTIDIEGRTIPTSATLVQRIAQ